MRMQNKVTRRKKKATYPLTPLFGTRIVSLCSSMWLSRTSNDDRNVFWLACNGSATYPGKTLMGGQRGSEEEATA